MSEEYNIVYVENPEQSVKDIIGQGIHNYNRKQAGDNKRRQLCYVLQDSDRAVVGGLLGSTGWDWLYIDILWIEERVRRNGYGHRLLNLAEEEARRRGARNAFLNSFSFQAPEFYKKYGYHIFGELHDFPPGQTQYFLTKQL